MPGCDIFQVFNAGFERLIGTFDAQTFERELRRDPNWQAEPADDAYGRAGGGGDDSDSGVGEDEDAADAGDEDGGDGREEAMGARRSRKKKQGLRRRAAGGRAAVGGDPGELRDGAEEEQWEQWPEALLGGAVGAGALDAD